MLLNMLNDLAEATKASDGKKIEHDGDERLSSIFFDKGRSASLHLLQDCQCFVLTKVSFPWLSALVIQFVVGGTVRSAGVPSANRNALSGNVAAGTAEMAITARRLSLSCISQEGDVFCAIADSESCFKVNPGWFHIYFHSKLRCETIRVLL